MKQENEILKIQQKENNVNKNSEDDNKTSFKEKIISLKEQTSSKTKILVEKTKEVAEVAVEKTKELALVAKEKSIELADKAKEEAELRREAKAEREEEEKFFEEELALVREETIMDSEIDENLLEDKKPKIIEKLISKFFKKTYQTILDRGYKSRQPEIDDLILKSKK